MFLQTKCSILLLFLFLRYLILINNCVLFFYLFANLITLDYNILKKITFTSLFKREINLISQQSAKTSISNKERFALSILLFNDSFLSSSFREPNAINS